eukprot:3508780-Rhodomonas_salina.1
MLQRCYPRRVRGAQRQGRHILDQHWQGRHVHLHLQWQGVGPFLVLARVGLASSFTLCLVELDGSLGGRLPVRSGLDSFGVPVRDLACWADIAPVRFPPLLQGLLCGASGSSSSRRGCRL